MLVCVSIIVIMAVLFLAYMVFKTIWSITIDLTGISLTDDDLKAGNED